MKKIFFLFALFFSFSSCITTRYVDQYGREHTQTLVHPVITNFVEGVAEAMTYNYNSGYFYDQYGYPVYNYHTGYLDQYYYGEQRYCKSTCTYRGQGHRHNYRNVNYHYNNNQRPNVIYNHQDGYYYDQNGYILLNYYTGHIQQLTSNGHRYCKKTCTYKGRGHRHNYYRQRNYYDGHQNTRRVTNQYYYGTNTYPRSRRRSNYRRQNFW